MPNDSRAARVICPFFVRYGGGLEILCEGLTDGVLTAMHFPTQRACKQWTANYCNCYSYGACPLAAILTQK